MRANEIPFTYRHVPGSSCPVMLLPGLAGKDWMWQSTVDELTQAGYGTIIWNAAVAQLDLDDPTSSITDLSNGAAELLDELSIGQVLACGNSLGALIGLEFANKHGDRTAGVVISGCPGLGEKIIDMSYFMNHDEREIVEELRRRMFYREPDSLPKEFVEEAMDMALHRPTTLRMLKVLRAAESYDTVESLRGIDSPASLIWGEHDVITPLENWKPYVTEFPDAELHVVPDCGHSPMIEKPDEWMDLLMDFARRVAPGAGQDGAAPRLLGGLSR